LRVLALARRKSKTSLSTNDFERCASDMPNVQSSGTAAEQGVEMKICRTNS
jgi:hypothetical protein